MSERINFDQLKSAYYELIKQYMLMLNKVSDRKVERVLRLAIEDHIRVKLLEIERSMQFTIHRHSTELDQDEITWLQTESNNCKETANHLRNANDTLKIIWKISWRTALVLITAAALIQFRELSSPEDVFLNLDMLRELVLRFLDYLVYGGIFLIYIIVIMMFIGFIEKRRMFAPGYEPIFGKIEDEEVTNNFTPIYLLEDQLFQQFDRDKRPEFKIDIPIILLFTFSMIVFIFYISPKYLEPYLGVTVSWVILGVSTLIFILAGIRYARVASRREFD